MPTYEYRCKECGHELEAQQSFSDDPLTDCPSCGGLLKKKFSAVGISFKGSGFYKTDSRSSSGKNGSSSSSSDSGTSSTSSSSSGSSLSGGSSDSTSGSSSTSSTSSSSSSTSTAAAS